MPDSKTATAGAVKKFKYYPDGRLKEIVYSDGTRERFKYNCCAIIEITDRAGGKTKFTYDSSHRKTSETTPDGLTTYYKYNSSDKLVEIIRPDGTSVKYAYDACGNRVLTEYADGTKVKTIYDAAGRKIKEIRTGNKYTVYKYDDRDRIISIRSNWQESVSYRYNACGQLIRYENHGVPYVINGRITRYIYDTSGRRILISYPDGTTERTVYFPGTRIVAYTERKGIITRYAYNSAGQIVEITKAPADYTPVASAGAHSSTSGKPAKNISKVFEAGSTRGHNINSSPCKPVKNISKVFERGYGGITFSSKKFSP